MMNGNYGDQLMHSFLLQKLLGNQNGQPMQMINGNGNQMMCLMFLEELLGNENED